MDTANANALERPAQMLRKAIMCSRYSIFLFATVIGMLGGSGCTALESRKATETSHASRVEGVPGTLRVLDWNVWEANGREGNPEGPARVFGHLPVEQVDVLLLQEVTAPVAVVLKERLGAAFDFHWCGDDDESRSRGIKSGTEWYPAIAIAGNSRFRTERTTCRVHDTGVNGHLGARVVVDGREVEIISVHLAPSNSLDFVTVQTKQIEALNLGGAIPTIIGGDFNALLWSSAIATLTSAGFIDSVASAHPSAVKPPTTAWPARFPLFRPRIDRVFHDGSFRTVWAHTGERGPSDHRPLLVTLQMTDPPRSNGGNACRTTKKPSHD